MLKKSRDLPNKRAKLISDEALIMNNLDVGLEIQKIRGGSILNEISTRMSAKMECLNKNTPGCKWISGLKYYAYSAVRNRFELFLKIELT